MTDVSYNHLIGIGNPNSFDIFL